MNIQGSISILASIVVVCALPLLSQQKGQWAGSRDSHCCKQGSVLLSARNWRAGEFTFSRQSTSFCSSSYYDEYSAKARPQGRTIVFGGSWTLKIPKPPAVKKP